MGFGSKTTTGARISDTDESRCTATMTKTRRRGERRTRSREAARGSRRRMSRTTHAHGRRADDCRLHGTHGNETATEPGEIDPEDGRIAQRRTAATPSDGRGSGLDMIVGSE
jgi:hypothetical protein